MIFKVDKRRSSLECLRSRQNRIVLIHLVYALSSC